MFVQSRIYIYHLIFNTLSPGYGGDGIAPTAVGILNEQQELNLLVDRNRADRNITQYLYRKLRMHQGFLDVVLRDIPLIGPHSSTGLY
jgi:hypothetical protein